MIFDFSTPKSSARHKMELEGGAFMKRNTTQHGSRMVAVTGSMTAALRAQRALASAAIRAEIVKSDSESGRGCGYGIAFAANQ